MTAAAVGLLLALPIWKESVAGKFILEPLNKAVVRVHVPGRVSQIKVREGESVAKGTLLARLSNMPLQSNLDEAQARLALASAQARDAELRYQEFGKARKQREESARHYAQVSQMNASLNITAPRGGTVITPRVEDQLGAYLNEGAQLLEIADLSEMRARIYISEYDIYKIRADGSADLQFDGRLQRRNGHAVCVSALPTEPLPGVMDAGNETGPQGLGQYFFVDIVLENPGNELKPGMMGIARVYGRRRSLGGIALETLRNFWGRKLW